MDLRPTTEDGWPQATPRELVEMFKAQNPTTQILVLPLLIQAVGELDLDAFVRSLGPKAPGCQTTVEGIRQAVEIFANIRSANRAKASIIQPPALRLRPLDSGTDDGGSGAPGTPLG